MSGPEPDSATVETGPNEWHDPIVRNEAKRAATWIGLVGLAALVVLLIQPILLIVAGAFIAVMFDGGARLLGRVLPVGRGWRLLIVVLGVTTFLLGTVYLGGVEIAAQFGQLRDTLTVQSARLSQLLNRTGLLPDSIDLASFSQQLSRSVGMLTSMLGAAFGGLTAIFLIAVIGLFLAMDPGTYARGTVWLFPRGRRDEMALLIDRIGFTLRRLFAGRLLGMAFEGTLTWVALTLGGVPMALLLGILSGILAFVPNIGAFITGILMVAVGFSAGTETGLWAFATYVVVQTFDGYVVIPIVAKKTVDLPPALTLSMQVLFAALFGLIGLALADPITASLKVILQRSAEREREEHGPKPGPDVEMAYETGGGGSD